MYAAMKGAVVDCFAITDYFDDEWPDWFFGLWDRWEDEGFGKEYGIWFYKDHKDGEFNSICLVPDESVLVRNKALNIKHIHIDDMSEQYWEMGKFKAALKTDCVAYRVYKDSTVQLENWKGEIRYMDLNLFLKHFEVPYLPPPSYFEYQ